MIDKLYPNGIFNGTFFNLINLNSNHQYFFDFDCGNSCCRCIQFNEHIYVGLLEEIFLVEIISKLNFLFYKNIYN